MKLKNLRLLVPLATLAVTAVLVAGCGGSSKTSGQSQGQDGTANATDSAFVQQMIPHHQMAVQMAQTAQREGRHGRIANLSGAIVAAQTREIGEMQKIAGQLGVKPDTMAMGGGMPMGGHMAEDAKALGVNMDQMGMSMNMDSLQGAKPFDRAFIDMMIPHHQGAIRMARAEQGKGTDAQLKAIAKGIVTDQTKEIGEMNSWRTQWYGAPSPAGGVPQA